MKCSWCGHQFCWLFFKHSRNGHLETGGVCAETPDATSFDPKMQNLIHLIQQSVENYDSHTEARHRTVLDRQTLQDRDPGYGKSHMR